MKGVSDRSYSYPFQTLNEILLKQKYKMQKFQSAATVFEVNIRVAGIPVFW